MNFKLTGVSPALSSKVTTATLLVHAARWSGVFPRESVVLGSAPFSNSSLQRHELPHVPQSKFTTQVCYTVSLRFDTQSHPVWNFCLPSLILYFKQTQNFVNMRNMRSCDADLQL